MNSNLWHSAKSSPVPNVEQRLLKLPSKPLHLCYKMQQNNPNYHDTFFLFLSNSFFFFFLHKIIQITTIPWLFTTKFRPPIIFRYVMELPAYSDHFWQTSSIFRGPPCSFTNCIIAESLLELGQSCFINSQDSVPDEKHLLRVVTFNSITSAWVRFGE